MPPSVLCVLPDDCWKTAVSQCAADGAFEPSWAPGPGEARAAVLGRRFDILLADLRPATDPRYNLLEFVRQQPRPMAVALVAGEEIMDGFYPLYRHRVGVALARAAPPCASALRRVFESLLNPSTNIGLENHLPPEAVIERGAIRSLADKNRMIEAAIRAVEQRGGSFPSAFDVRLVFEEIVNNAILHAFGVGQEDRRQRLGEFTKLGESEQVAAQFSVGPTWTAMAVQDNRGALHVDKVLETMYRQMSLQGLTDESGRGLFLAWNLCDVLNICVVPGQVTEVTALFNQPAHSRNKSLCIYEPLLPVCAAAEE